MADVFKSERIPSTYHWEFSPDGQHIYFTSDRGGAAQIYAAPPQANARARRVTFNVTSASRPR